MNIAIICSNALLRNIYPFLKRKDNINIVGETDDGAVGLELIEDKHPELIIMSLVLTTYDGIELLKKLKNKRIIGNKKGTKCIAISECNSEFILNKLESFPLDYILVYPFKIKILYERIMDLFIYENDFNNIPKAYLYNLDNFLVGIFPKINLDGYCFVKDALLLSYENEDYLNSATKVLYPEIAKLHDKKGINVERSIRTIIDSAWKSNDAKNKMIEYNIINEINSERPTNMQFIKALYKAYKYKNDKN